MKGIISYKFPLQFKKKTFYLILGDFRLATALDKSLNLKVLKGRKIFEACKGNVDKEKV
jgi:hypothetical protein